MAKPKRVTYFKTMLEDKPGTGLAFAQSLKSKKINLSALWAYGTQTGQSEVFCIPKDVDKFRAFVKSAGITTWEGSGFILKGEDKPGALVKSLEALANAGVNVNAIHAIAAGGNFGAFVKVPDAEVDKAASALGAK
jgi:hypothetical protein